MTEKEAYEKLLATARGLGDGFVLRHNPRDNSVALVNIAAQHGYADSRCPLSRETGCQHGDLARGDNWMECFYRLQLNRAYAAGVKCRQLYADPNVYAELDKSSTGQARLILNLDRLFDMWAEKISKIA